MNTLTIEEDGDEIFTPITSVKCCSLGWNNGGQLWSQIIKIPYDSTGRYYWGCEKCRGSYSNIYNKSNIMEF